MEVFLEGTPQNHPTAASPLTSKSSAKARVFSSAPSSHGFTMLRWMGELFFGITITTFFRINFCLSLSFLYLLFRLWIAADNPKVVWSIGWWVHDLPQLLVWSHCARKNLVWPSCRWSFPLDFGPKSITAQANHHPKKRICSFLEWKYRLPWLRKFGICSSPWFSSLCVQFQDVGRRERFLSETSRVGHQNQIPTLHLWWVSWKFPFHNTRGNSDFFCKFHILSPIHFRGLYVISSFQMINGFKWSFSRFPATFPRDQFKSILELVKRSETHVWSDCTVPLSCPP